MGAGEATGTWWRGNVEGVSVMLRLRRGYGSIVRRLRRTPAPTPAPVVERMRDALPELTLDTSTDGLRLRPVETLPYARSEPMPSKGRPIDPSGRHVWRDKTRHVRPHPVAQAQFALATLESHRAGGTARDLKQSIVNAGDAARRVRHGFAPYGFDFPLHGEADNTIHAPWYSAMAQGQLLSLASRLAHDTRDEQFHRFGENLFATLTAEYRHDALPDTPWVTFVDAEGMLWFEEYAGDVEPMRVLNGHLFAMFGLYDWWALTGSTDAERLFARGAETVLHYASRLRVVGEASWYGMRVQHTRVAQSPKYHRIHIAQLQHVAAMTGDGRFLQVADAFASDIGMLLPTVPEQL